MLKDVLSVLGNRKISISREISKKFEEVYRGCVSDVIEQLKAREILYKKELEQDSNGLMGDVEIGAFD